MGMPPSHPSTIQDTLFPESLAITTRPEKPNGDALLRVVPSQTGHSLRSSQIPVAGSSAHPTTASTRLIAVTFPPISSMPENASSLPRRVTVQCAHCAKLVPKYRSMIERVKPGTPLYCSQTCRYAPARVDLTCEGCGASYTKPRCEVEKAKRNGFARQFCTKTCFLATTSRMASQRSADISRTAVVTSAAALITSETIRTETGRRRYYSPEIAALSDGVHRKRACVVCGTVRKSTAPVCRPCFLAAKASTYLTTCCSYCGGEFIQMRAEAEKRQRRGQVNFYCSHECAGRALKGPGCPCLKCGTPTGSRDRKRRYCSKECRLSVSRAGKDRPCPQCGKLFFPRGTRTQFCDRVCADAAHSARMVGLNNPHYKDGTSYAEHFKRMRPLIFERDGNQCRACLTPDKMVPTGRKTGALFKTHLVVHHLNEEPWDNRPENLILLCATCHMVHHKSATTPYPWFATYTESATRSMTSKWTAQVTSLQTRFLSTTA